MINNLGLGLVLGLFSGRWLKFMVYAKAKGYGLGLKLGARLRVWA